MRSAEKRPDSQIEATILLSGDTPVVSDVEGKTQFKIALKIINPPPDALTIIYQLDGDTYSEPVRMVTKGVPNFEEVITASKDTPILVSYRSTTNPSELHKLLSDHLSVALGRSYVSLEDGPVKQAIERIKNG
jgi:hypothetical protein